jgi:Zn-dependent M28 family amino/carboxypeptidase
MGRFGVAGCALLVCACGSRGEHVNAAQAPAAGARAPITQGEILTPIQVLASDAFAGRAPGTHGEELTVRYLTERFTALGLEPGNPDGTYVESVPFIGFTSTPRASIDIGGRPFALAFPDDYVAGTRRAQPHVSVDGAEIVFVGYGVEAPEYAWDDYKGEDVRGKVLLMLIGDPPVPDPADPAKLDPNVFKGRAMTYYGRWSYKYEIAARKGAAAAIIVHQTEGAGYPYEVVRTSFSKEALDIAGGNDDEKVPVQAWIALARAKALLTETGHDLDALTKAALRRDFRPVHLGAKAHVDIDTKLREMRSANVIGKLTGSDPRAKGEYVMYTAHWDHLGTREGGAGDGIYNGAIDNASGVATMLAIARAFTALPHRPRRSVLFLSPTGEEAGLLGAKYYAAHPLYPLASTLADINMDCMNLWGRTHAIVSIGEGSSTLDDLLAAAAREQGRVVMPDPEPEKGYFYRSDHFELMKKGVPALHFLHPGSDYVGKAPTYGAEKRAAYVAHDYHRVSDDVRADWDLEGAVEDARLLFEVGRRIAEGETVPQWREGSEFRRGR